MKTIIITNDPHIAADAREAGVSRIMVDLESIGKKQRQAARNTYISDHIIEDVEKISEVVGKSGLMVRINPFHPGSQQEIEQVIAAGTGRIMLPMITDMEQLDESVKLIAGRAGILPLVETAYSMAHIADIAAHPSVDEIYIGLNDLHLSLGLDFLFEPLAQGILDWMAEIIRSHNKPFGFGGIAAMGSGELPAEYILAEHIRLGSSWVILSSRFCSDIDIANAKGRIGRIRHALRIMQGKEQEFLARNAQQAEDGRRITASIIRNLASTLHKARKKS